MGGHAVIACVGSAAYSIWIHKNRGAKKGTEHVGEPGANKEGETKNEGLLPPVCRFGNSWGLIGERNSALGWWEEGG